MGNPEQDHGANTMQLTAFGERPVFSPDGLRIAFIGRSFGDAFEIDLKTKMIRILTGHFRHEGFLRVNYLPNGDILLTGARKFTDVRTTRGRDQELWIMKADAKTPPVPLNQKVFEGVAVSGKQMKIVWVNISDRFSFYQPTADMETIFYMADIVTRDGKYILENKKEVLRTKANECIAEPQGFRLYDSELIYTCYKTVNNSANIMGIKLDTGQVITYRGIEKEFNEAEGLSPDGKWVLVESGPAVELAKRPIDLWKLILEPNGKNFVRLTRWGDYLGYKATNPDVSPDGKWIAFQSGRVGEEAGVGHGIFLLKLK